VRVGALSNGINELLLTLSGHERTNCVGERDAQEELEKENNKKRMEQE
jgi:hypothetical protein